MRDAIDQKLTVAMYDVPVPEGLAERLLMRLDEADKQKNTTLAAPADRSSFLTASMSRRWLVTGAGFLAVAASLLVAVWLGTRTSENLTEQFVLDEAIRLFNQGIDQPGPLLSDGNAPSDYPFSTAVIQLQGARWRPLQDFLGRRGIVYDLPGPAGTSASLYVIESDGIDDWGQTPAMRPFTTAGCCASSWQEGRMLYVLVVQGDPSIYRAYLNLVHGPMA